MQIESQKQVAPNNIYLTWIASLKTIETHINVISASLKSPSSSLLSKSI